MAAVAALNTYVIILQGTRVLLDTTRRYVDRRGIFNNNNWQPAERTGPVTRHARVSVDRVRPLARISARAHYHTLPHGGLYDGVSTIYDRIIMRMSANRLVGYIIIITSYKRDGRASIATM